MTGISMKKYVVYLDDGKSVFKEAIPGRNEQEAIDYVAGNGEVVAVKDMTANVPISVEKVAKALISAGFGECETDLITRTLIRTNICDC